MTDRKAHWDAVYQSKQPDAVSWYLPSLEQSLDMISKTGIELNAPLIDVGGGASTLVDDLLRLGYSDISVLDISAEALNVSKKRMGARAASVKWIVGDVTACSLPSNHFALWHDRAVFHFLTSDEERSKYCGLLRNSVRSSGFAIMATFGPNGPSKCSGIDIARYSPALLQSVIGETFNLISSCVEQHTTPFNTTQEFIYCLFRRS